MSLAYTLDDLMSTLSSYAGSETDICDSQTLKTEKSSYHASLENILS